MPEKKKDENAVDVGKITAAKNAIRKWLHDNGFVFRKSGTLECYYQTDAAGKRTRYRLDARSVRLQQEVDVRKDKTTTDRFRWVDVKNAAYWNVKVEAAGIQFPA